MRTKISTEPQGTITFANVSNHLASSVSDLPEYVAKNRNISALKMAPSSGIKRADGSIHTGFYPNSRSLSKEDREQVSGERRKRKRGGKAGGQKSVKAELQSLKKKVGKTIDGGCMPLATHPHQYCETCFFQTSMCYLMYLI